MEAQHLTMCSGTLQLSQIRVLDNLDEELSDTTNQLEARTGAQIVGKMGRTLLLYRPSMRKLKAAQAAEEKAYKYQKRKNLLTSRMVNPFHLTRIPMETFIFMICFGMIKKTARQDSLYYCSF